MPEGDTIHRAASQMRQAIDDSTIVEASARRDLMVTSKLLGKRVCAVRAQGKHLFLHLDDAHVIHSHMGMTGSWHLYPTHAKWSKPKRLAHLVLEFDNGVTCVCFTPKVLELMTEKALKRHPYLAKLGPDLLADEFDEAEALRRFRIHDVTPLGVAVLNQTLVCGIGNVYKSELLFLNGWNPFARVSCFSDAQLRQLFRAARKLLRRNLGGAPRRTRMGRDGPRLWVYNRSGERCLKCGTKIRMRRQGDLGRSTYWCPECQPTPDEQTQRNDGTGDRSK